MYIEDGWQFNSSDFSTQVSYGDHCPGTVTLIRDADSKRQWHMMPDELRCDPDGPPLYILGSGLTFEDALDDANARAATAKQIPEVTE